MKEKGSSLLYEFGVDAEHRRIYLINDIDDDMYEVMAKAMYRFGQDDRKEEPIEILICSDGGSVTSMFAMYDLIRGSDSPVNTIISGWCASAACLVAVAGHHRFATENAYMMQHNAKAWAVDLTDREMEARAGYNKAAEQRCYQLLAKHTKKSAKWWSRSVQEEGEKWINAKEMLEWGIVDEIISAPGPVKKRAKKRKRIVKRIVRPAPEFDPIRVND